ncbi:hypothetical protein [Jannaschia ovalis]|uniref:Uncharacterized protein n=1 Tax=Jannaschia ovalis TaxID=3038773 RepID=A0ABY8LCT2_9RHOB|nr:hypothetical protein [Jannaschia sp. GRR-S6-38]WGH79137.1 hypothetical protein P8627_02420 [Jannaschia sp. GRR-S6-38]
MPSRLLLVTALLTAAGPAQASLCDYKPSRLISAMAASEAAGTVGTAAVQAGRYTLIGPEGSNLLTAASSAGAAASGLAAGVSGLLAGAAAVVTAPVTIVAGSVTAVALGGYEGACYFAVERVTDRDRVEAILRNMEAGADPDRFALVTPEATGELTLVLRDPATPEAVGTYEVRNLYIADGTLLHRDRLLNTKLGQVVFVDDAPGGVADPVPAPSPEAGDD